MFNWETDSKYFYFFIKDRSGAKVPSTEWNDYQDNFLSQISILQEWLDNGKAEEVEGAVRVEIEEVLSLSDVDLVLLELPDLYPYVVYIGADGTLPLNSFKFKTGFYDFVPNGNRLNFKKEGAILRSEEASYLLSSNQFKVLSLVERFNSLPETERTFKRNLKSLFDIKNLTSDEATTLDTYLQSEEVFYPENISVDISFENDVLEVVPTVEGLNKESLIKAFDLRNAIKPVYRVENIKGEKTRVVFDDQQQEGLQSIKNKRRITDPFEIDQLVENPEIFLDDNVIDLAYFSQRVREIGIYKPKFYPFATPYKSAWIPGIVLKDKVNGEKRIHFKNEVELAEFEAEVNTALSEGKTNFRYQDEVIAVSDAKKFISTAHKQFENPDEPVRTQENPNSEEVLIIKENADLLEYTERSSFEDSFIHEFMPISNLSSNIELKDHQKEGVAWVQSLYRRQVNGCLLADDMGLGKTLQILYFLEWHAQYSRDDKPYLIVAPVSILENWEAEYEKFFQPRNLELKTINSTSGIGREFSKQRVTELQKKQILLTNYESLRSYQLTMCAVDYAVVVLDEAQRVKTPGTMITNVSKALKSDFKIAMTGTPVENSLVDLWCIMDFAVPGLLGNAKDFANIYQKPLSKVDVDVEELGQNLREQIGMFIKRRLKSDVAKDLPEKRTKIYRQPMPPVQMDRYSVEIDLANNPDSKEKILKSINAIKSISDHPFLADNQVNKYNVIELINSSAKLKILVEVLGKVKSKEEKAIIFAERKETQKLIQRVVYKTFLIRPPSIINGDTPSSKQKANSSKMSRQQTINRFQREKGFNVIIMSPLAAGVGLNVTGANHVIHYSRHWNPAKEDQATDRAYRIGQTKDVTVHYPMAVFPPSFRTEEEENPLSFDEILDELLTRKRSLATSTLFPTEQIEINPNDVYNGVFRSRSKETLSKPLSLEDIDKLKPLLFEAFVAALYSKQGYSVHLTPWSNDKGADVIALRADGNVIIQAKQSQSSISNKAIQEIVTAVNYYRNLYKEDFKTAVLSNGWYGESATTLAFSNEVSLVDRKNIEQLISHFPVSLKDIYFQEEQRLDRI